MYYIWPVIQSGINALGGFVLASGYGGTWLYGFIERALIPFGLHHVFYIPFWQTALGGTAMVGGALVFQQEGTNYVVSVKEWESHEVELLLDEVVCTYDFAPQQFSLF